MPFKAIFIFFNSKSQDFIFHSVYVIPVANDCKAILNFQKNVSKEKLSPLSFTDSAI